MESIKPVCMSMDAYSVLYSITSYLMSTLCKSLSPLNVNKLIKYQALVYVDVDKLKKVKLHNYISYLLCIL